MKDLKDFIVTIPNYPKEGIMFRDITSVIQSAEGLQLAIDSMQNLVKDIDYDVIVGPESRGFVFGMPMAYNDHKPFVMVRKPGKLPRETISQSYDLEYGSATLEIHKDALYPGEKVLIVDDLIATGGTTEAIVKLVERLDAKVAGMVFLMELKGLHGRDRLKDYRIEAAISYDGK